MYYFAPPFPFEGSPALLRYCTVILHPEHPLPSAPLSPGIANLLATLNATHPLHICPCLSFLVFYK